MCAHMCICVQMVEPDSGEGDTFIFGAFIALLRTVYMDWLTPLERNWELLPLLELGTCRATDRPVALFLPTTELWYGWIWVIVRLITLFRALEDILVWVKYVHNSKYIWLLYWEFKTISLEFPVIFCSSPLCPTMCLAHNTGFWVSETLDSM